MRVLGQTDTMQVAGSSVLVVDGHCWSNCRGNLGPRATVPSGHTEQSWHVGVGWQQWRSLSGANQTPTLHSCRCTKFPASWAASCVREGVHPPL